MIAAALGFTAPVPVMAAQTLTQITHGDWLLVCNQAEEDADEQCALTHSVVAPQNKVQLLGLALTYDKVVDTYPAQFTVPLGGALGPGFLLEVEGQELLAMPFARCDANGCYVEQVLAREVVELLAEGVTVTFADRLGQPLAITLSSNGVASGLADLEDRAITWSDTLSNVWGGLSDLFGESAEGAEQTEASAESEEGLEGAAAESEQKPNSEGTAAEDSVKAEAHESEATP